MASYLHKAAIFKLTENVIGIDVGQNDLDKEDFETNYKFLAKKIDSLIIAETTFEVEKKYTQLKALVDGVTITWTDIKYIETDEGYKLYLLRDTLL